MIQDLKHLGLVVCFWLGMVSLAQGQAGSLHGSVMDPSGAVVPGAAVTLNGNGQTLNTTSGPDGRYAFRGLASAAACRSRAARFRRRGGRPRDLPSDHVLVLRAWTVSRALTCLMRIAPFGKRGIWRNFGAKFMT